MQQQSLIKTTRSDLIFKKWRPGNKSKCRGCDSIIEWWLDPDGNGGKGQWAPYNLMANDESEAISHFADCPNANTFRKPRSSGA